MTWVLNKGRGGCFLYAPSFPSSRQSRWARRGGRRCSRGAPRCSGRAGPGRSQLFAPPPPRSSVPSSSSSSSRLPLRTLPRSPGMQSSGRQGSTLQTPEGLQIATDSAHQRREGWACHATRDCPQDKHGFRTEPRPGRTENAGPAEALLNEVTQLQGPDAVSVFYKPEVFS